MGWVGGWVLVPFWIALSSLVLVISPIFLDLLSFSIPSSLFLTHPLTISLSLSLSPSLPFSFFLTLSQSLLVSLSLSLSLSLSFAAFQHCKHLLQRGQHPFQHGKHSF